MTFSFGSQKLALYIYNVPEECFVPKYYPPKYLHRAG